MTEDILAVLVLLSLAVNFFHWRDNATDKILHLPNSGWLKLVFGIWSFAGAATALLCLAGLFAAVVCVRVMMPLCIAQEVYSVWRRRKKRKRLA